MSQEPECVVGELTQDAIDELKAKHGVRLHAWELEEVGAIVWKHPSVATWRKFTDGIANVEQPRSELLLELVTSTVVYPAPQQLSQLLRTEPTLLNQVAKQIQESAAVKQKKAPVRL